MIPRVIETLVIDGEDLRVLPSSLDIQPFKSRSTAAGKFGDVQIEWPGMRASAAFTVQYSNLCEEDADALALMCSDTPGLSKTVAFGRGSQHPVYSCRRVRCEPSQTDTGWDVSLIFTAIEVPL